MKSSCFLLAVLLSGMPLLSLAQVDGGVVTRLRGDVTYHETGLKGFPVSAFMKIRAHDRVILPVGAEITIVYFASARVEAWRGPATFVIGAKQSEKIVGDLLVTSLPAVAPPAKELARVTILSRLGGIIIRGVVKPGDDLAQARERYERWRAAAVPADLLPDFYYLAVLQEHGRRDEMKSFLDALRANQPGNFEVEEIARRTAAVPL